MRVPGVEASSLAFSTTWDVLGPFQIGTREATWGADPLERLGGFRSLVPNVEAKYASSLAPGGLVSWQKVRAQNGDTASQSETNSLLESICAEVSISFGQVDWSSRCSMYGWPALQWQAWMRGRLENRSSRDLFVLLHIDSVLEYWVDKRHVFGGDYYAFRRAPLIIKLTPGAHVLNVRLLRDVRLDGARIPPDLHINMEASIHAAKLIIHTDKQIVPETVLGKPAGAFMSVPLTNNDEVTISVHSVHFTLQDADDNGCIPSTDSIGPPPDQLFSLTIQQTLPFRLAPGQTRSLVLRIHFQGIKLQAFKFKLIYSSPRTPSHRESQSVLCRLKDRDIHEPHRITYLHPNGAVSFALLCPPHEKGSGEALPILLLLHGAGVDVNGPETRKVFETWPAMAAWTLVPSGVTSWASDDWHGLGVRDVEAAVEHLKWWKTNTNWCGSAVQSRKWLVVGHSNGGQGVWQLLTHRPDKIIGGAAISGYSSIEAYVPYTFWNEDDAGVSAWVSRSLQDARHETLLVNATHIPIYIQHGSEDDNVPVSHSRRMFQLLSQLPSSSVRYSELPGKGHWFDGVLVTQGLLSFYSSILRQPQHPALAPEFDISVSNPATMGTKAGIKVVSIIEPNRMGSVHVSRFSTEWQLATNNVSRFRFTSSPYFDDLAQCIIVDGQHFELHEKVELLRHEFQAERDGTWNLIPSSDVHASSSYQQGPLDSILRSQASFSIDVNLPDCFGAALQISRNLYQYFGADSWLTSGSVSSEHSSANVITVSTGLPHGGTSDAAIRISESGITIEMDGGRRKIFPLERNIAAIYLSPLTGKRLELVVWGLDAEGLRLASRLFPLLTGVGQPGFVVVSKRYVWSGLSGVLAMGSFTADGRASKCSFTRSNSQAVGRVSSYEHLMS